MKKVCKTCGQEKLRIEFPSTGRQKRKDGSFRSVVKPDCKLCHNANQLALFNKRLASLGIQFKCVRCGYDRYSGNIDFHHKDPKEKDFRISERTSVSLESLTKEVNKCIVLCKLCHGELHADLWQLDDLTVGL